MSYEKTYSHFLIFKYIQTTSQKTFTITPYQNNFPYSNNDTSKNNSSWIYFKNLILSSNSEYSLSCSDAFWSLWSFGNSSVLILSYAAFAILNSSASLNAIWTSRLLLAIPFLKNFKNSIFYE